MHHDEKEPAPIYTCTHAPQPHPYTQPTRTPLRRISSQNKAPYIDKSIVRANERIQELQVDNLHLSYYGTSILRELQDEKQAVAQMRDQIQSLEERQKIYIEELAGRAADVMRCVGLPLPSPVWLGVRRTCVIEKQVWEDCRARSQSGVCVCVCGGGGGGGLQCSNKDISSTKQMCIVGSKHTAALQKAML